MQRFTQSWSPALRVGLLALGTVAVAATGRAIITNLQLVGTLHTAQAEHADQAELVALVQNNQTEEAFAEAFEHGDELFETVFNALDGVGANVGNGQRFTRVPRADLVAPGQWAAHVPPRATGPNAQACNACHSLPSDDGAGSVAANVHRDPLHSGVLARFIQRNTPHLFALGALQRLAEEMTAEMQATRDAVVLAACADPNGNSRSARLSAKGISFGSISAQRRSTANQVCPPPYQRRGRVRVATDRVVGVDADLVVKAFQWKGNFASLRSFNRDAAHNELGMQAVEIVGDGVDGDGDGVVDEMTIGDQTALAVYLAAQPRPTTLVELAALGQIDPLPADRLASIQRGAAVFRAAACDTCHAPRLLIADPVFSEPSQHPAFRDAVFPAGQDPVALGVDPRLPLTFDLTADQPDNVVRDLGGNVVHLGSLATDAGGRAIVELYGDLKRHDLGSGLAEGIDETGTGASVFMTENLWGVGSTAPYLHDGRATTLTEAILEHGGEAAASRTAFRARSAAEQADLIAFLDNLVCYKVPEP